MSGIKEFLISGHPSKLLNKNPARLFGNPLCLYREIRCQKIAVQQFFIHENVHMNFFTSIILIIFAP
jgi:hypothetical protein